MTPADVPAALKCTKPRTLPTSRPKHRGMRHSSTREHRTTKAARPERRALVRCGEATSDAHTKWSQGLGSRHFPRGWKGGRRMRRSFLSCKRRCFACFCEGGPPFLYLVLRCATRLAFPASCVQAALWLRFWKAPPFFRHLIRSAFLAWPFVKHERWVSTRSYVPVHYGDAIVLWHGRLWRIITLVLAASARPPDLRLAMIFVDISLMHFLHKPVGFHIP